MVEGHLLKFQGRVRPVFLLSKLQEVLIVGAFEREISKCQRDGRVNLSRLERRIQSNKKDSLGLESLVCRVVGGHKVDDNHLFNIL